MLFLLAVAILPTGSALQVAGKTKESTCDTKAACIPAYTGRLGNNLLDLEYAMEAATAHNYCFVVLPEDAGSEGPAQAQIEKFLKLPEDRVIRLDGGANNISRKEIEAACSVKCYGCEACSGQPRWPVSKASKAFEKHVVQPGLLLCSDADSMNATNDTLVMHLRSGDTLSMFASDYRQPPCAFYAQVMRSGHNGSAFQQGLIVTEPDRLHPCISYLKDAFPGKIHVQSQGVRADACTMAHATHLALSHGSWDAQLLKLNRNLSNLYVPDLQWQVSESVALDGHAPYAQHVVSFPNFTSTGWKDVPSKFQEMLQYDVRSVTWDSLPPRARVSPTLLTRLSASLAQRM